MYWYKARLSAFFYCSYVESSLAPTTVDLVVLSWLGPWQTLPPPPLKPLHSNTSLSPAKLAQMEQLSTEILAHSLAPGQRDSLKTRPDGTILDGHHRIHVLRVRGVDVDTLPREIVEKGNF